MYKGLKKETLYILNHFLDGANGAAGLVLKIYRSDPTIKISSKIMINTHRISRTTTLADS
jgi:hypothetical protein